MKLEAKNICAEQPRVFRSTARLLLSQNSRKLNNKKDNIFIMPASTNITKINVDIPDYIDESFKMHYKISAFDSFSSFMSWVFSLYLEDSKRFPLEENDIISYSIDSEKRSSKMTFYIPASMAEIIGDLALRTIRDKRKQSLFIVYSIYKNIEQITLA